MEKPIFVIRIPMEHVRQISAKSAMEALRGVMDITVNPIIEKLTEYHVIYVLNEAENWEFELYSVNGAEKMSLEKLQNILTPILSDEV